VKGDVPSPLAPPSGCRFHTRCPLASELCAQQAPAFDSVGQDRFVACHHWQQAAALAPETRSEPLRSAGAERRFALYREWSDKKQVRLPNPSVPGSSTPPTGDSKNA
jgi:peptide/nickel transport system ATP-binding protein